MSHHSIGRRKFLKTAVAGTTAAALGAAARDAFAFPAKPALEAGLGSAPAPAAGLPANILGKTGQRVPRLLLGTAMDFDMRLLKTAYEQGVTYFDTADCYGGGRSELTIGNFLEKTGLRKNIWLTTKSCPQDPRAMENSLKTSLGRLKTDYVDLFFLHNLSRMEALDGEMRQTVDRLKREGRIRFFGFSTHSPNVAEALEHASKLGWIEAIMFKYNFRAYGDSELNRAMDAAKRASIGLIAMKTQGSAFSFQNKVDAFQVKGFRKHPAVLKAVWEDQRIDAAVSEMKNVQQLDQNVGAAKDLTKLGALELDELRRYAQETSASYCRGCNHVCTAGLPRPVAVADTLRFLMYHDEYGELERARRLFRELPAPLREFHASELEAAARACPHGLDVASLVTRAKKVLG